MLHVFSESIKEEKAIVVAFGADRPDPDLGPGPDDDPGGESGPTGPSHQEPKQHMNINYSTNRCKKQNG
eukprot:169617-Amphidinium_carterae.1